MIGRLGVLMLHGLELRWRFPAGSADRRTIDRLFIAANRSVLVALVVGDESRYRAAVIALNQAVSDFATGRI